jgi:uncharacterized membrane protein
MNIEQKLDQWRNEGLLDQAAVDRINDYENRRPEESKQKKVPLLLLIGLIFLSLAVFSFIAANWQVVPDLLKTGFVVMLMWIFYILAHLADRKKLGWPVFFRVIGLAMFMASIIVTAQAFHFPASNSILPWAMFIAAAFHVFYWKNMIFSIITFFFGIMILTSSLPVMSWMEWILFVTAVLLLFLISREKEMTVFSWLLLFGAGPALWAVAAYNSPFWPIWTLFALVLLLLFVPSGKIRLLSPFYMSAGGGLLIIYLAVRGETDLSLVNLNWTEALTLAAAGAAVFTLAFFKFQPLMWIGLLGGIGLMLFDDTALLLAATAQLSALAYLFTAQRQDKSLGVGFVYFILVQFVIYVIYAWDRLDMSLFFLIGALLLFALSGAAWWYNRKKEGAAA